MGIRSLLKGDPGSRSEGTRRVSVRQGREKSKCKGALSRLLS